MLTETEHVPEQSNRMHLIAVLCTARAYFQTGCSSMLSQVASINSELSTHKILHSVVVYQTVYRSELIVFAKM